MAKELWVEKYRPDTLDGYVFTDERQRSQIEGWIKEGSIPHLMFSGRAGVGKTTLAKILINKLGVEDSDVLYANGSKEGRKIEWVDRLIGFCQTMPFGPFKIVLIDEADFLNAQSVQPALRNLMEEYSNSVRFILTCNYPNRIIPALHSRCQGFHIEETDRTEFTARVATILVEENVEFDLDTLDTFVNATYPDLRKCINNAQMNSINGILSLPQVKSTSTDYRIEMVDLFKRGEFEKARHLLCTSARQEEIEEIFRWMYDNIELFGSTEEKRDTAVLLIKQGIIDHAICADSEINLAAVMVKLARLQNQ